ncbi:hypothetical protein [Methylobacterium sp. E-045]|uniref:hypothetical protein n=1 Tax=Methylobacterium sp. E-045 TaxID=2836575 RepID=UPI001FB876D0|nr:hypothetical protein [Methylobacterium sp. E-045]MCJ2131583.1 hypothetical protein [Methylobacterium sp. E-045]
MSEFEKGAIDALKDMKKWHVAERAKLPNNDEEFAARKAVHDRAIEFIEDEIGRRGADMASAPAGTITSGG